jgi:hypothetical protein
MVGRIETLLKKFGLQNFYNDLKKPTVLPRKYPVEHIEDVLNAERERSLLFLRKAINKNY